MRKFITIGITGVVLVLAVYFMFIYFATYSEGFRSGELVKISKRGWIFKTWEGSLSQGVSESQHFDFSVEDGDKEVLDKLRELQGNQVKLTYIERFGTFPWLGDTKYFVKGVERVNFEK